MAGYTSFLDMLNGGGAGTAGDEFEGGLFSDLLNAMGMRPMGYADRQAASPQPAVAASSMGGGGGGGVPPSPPAAPPPSGLGAFGMLPGTDAPITASPLPAPGATPTPELLAMLEQFLKQAPTATGYGPR
jgi:hypothetical protein